MLNQLIHQLSHFGELTNSSHPSKISHLLNQVVKQLVLMKPINLLCVCFFRLARGVPEHCWFFVFY